MSILPAFKVRPRKFVITTNPMAVCGMGPFERYRETVPRSRPKQTNRQLFNGKVP